MAELGLTYDDLRARNPALIVVSITPFGSTGLKSGYAESDLVLWAAGGPLHPHRDGDGPPLRISVPQSWLHAAADGAGGALVAHFARLSTGRGQHVDISAQQSVAQATLSAITSAAVGHDGYLTELRARATGASKWQARDGLVELPLPMGPALGVWSNNLFALMRREGALSDRFREWDWITAPDRIAAGEATLDDVAAARAEVAAFVAAHGKRELGELAMAHKVLLAPVNDMADLLSSPHMLARGFFADVVEDGVGRTLPWAFALGPEGMFAEPSGAPKLGEHNAEVYGALLGAGPGDLLAWRDGGLI